MRRAVRAIRDRLVPALLTAAGVALLAGGVLEYGSPVEAGLPAPLPSPSVSAGIDPSFIAPSLPPLNGSPPPKATPSLDAHPLATRVVIQQLDIDLPIIAQPNPSYPSCNVAMYYQDPRLGQPGSGRSIYIYAHARDGMFGPLYERAILKRNGGARSLIGMPVEIYTSDDQRYVYLVTKVLPNVKADSHFLDGPLAVTSETLWLQTSTGPNGSYPKLQVVAKPLGVTPADHKAAHPRAHPINCA